MSTEQPHPLGAFDLLIPRPRLCRAQGWSAVSGAPILALARAHGLDAGAWMEAAGALHLDHVADGNEQGGAYRLVVPSAKGASVTLAASDDEGFRNARATLVQLARAFISLESRPNQSLPACEIEDAPALLVRGVMLDVSRLRVPTMTHLLGVIDQLALLKFNHGQLYIEP